MYGRLKRKAQVVVGRLTLAAFREREQLTVAGLDGRASGRAPRPPVGRGLRLGSRFKKAIYWVVPGDTGVRWVPAESRRASLRANSVLLRGALALAGARLRGEIARDDDIQLRRDSNPQPPDSKSDTLSIAPRSFRRKETRSGAPSWAAASRGCSGARRRTRS